MSALVTLRSGTGEAIGLSISNLRDDTWGPDKIPKIDHDESSGQLQLLEECEYEFRLIDGPNVVELQPSEIFDLSNSGTSGRVRPRGRAGMVRVEARDSSGIWHSADIEVRSRKLGYKEHYRWMLDRIANEATELALLPFAASRLSSLVAEHSQTPETLYQRFEFLQARLKSDEFLSAVEQLRFRPHTEFREERQRVPVERSIRGGRGLARQLAKPGERVRLDRPIGTLTTLPRMIEQVTYEESLDTVPNRFVRYVIEGWLALVDVVALAIAEAVGSKQLPSQARAGHQIGQARAQLEDIMRIPAVREAGRLTQFPASNTVVRSRAGYREVMAAFQASNALAGLLWDQEEGAMSAGQHDVPTLYEYWVFLEIVRLIGTLPEFTVVKESLVGVSDNGLSLQLRKANEVVVRATGVHNGVEVELELWFNKSFSYRQKGGVEDDASWSVQMRPDVSLSIEPIGLTTHEKTWLHFDAKYKVKRYTKDFEDAENDDEEKKHALPADIQKMHAYRDAIRRSAGAYVIYPGTEPLPRQQYHELLPGLGAFALRPSPTGDSDAHDANGLRRFLIDVIDHLTSQGTSYQRDRHWRSEVHERAGYLSPTRPFLERPPLDTPVLLGYVRSAEHASALRSLQLYNLRADPGREGAVDVQSAELGAELLVLYGQGTATAFRATGEVVLKRGVDLEVHGYEPRGSLYLCLAFEPEPLESLDEEIVYSLVRTHGGPGGAPVAVTWADLEPQRQELEP